MGFEWIRDEQREAGAVRGQRHDPIATSDRAIDLRQHFGRQGVRRVIHYGATELVGHSAEERGWLDQAAFHQTGGERPAAGGWLRLGQIKRGRSNQPAGRH